MENLKTVSALVKNILEHDHGRNTDNFGTLFRSAWHTFAMTVPVFLKELEQKVQATYLTLLPVRAYASAEI